MKRSGVLFLFFISTIFILNLALPQLCFSALDRQEEINKYIEMLESPSNKIRIDAAKIIARSGLSDQKLFNIINERLLNIDTSKSTASKYIDELSWYCKALASSGKLEYKETLETVAKSNFSAKLTKYAKESIENIEKYASLNEIINDTSNAPAGQSLEVTRYINMLKSGDDVQIKTAAKQMYRHPSTDSNLYEVAINILLDNYLENTGNGYHMDTIAWLCKALGSSGYPDAKATLEEVINNTKNGTLRKYANESLSMLD